MFYALRRVAAILGGHAVRLHRSETSRFHSITAHYTKKQWHRFRAARRVCRSKTRALLLTLTDPPCGRTSQGMAMLPVVGSHLPPLDPARRDVSTHRARASSGAQVATMWRTFTLFEARSINFAIVV